MSNGWGLLALCVAGSSLVSILVYYAVAGHFHFRYYVRRSAEAEQWKLQPERFLTPELHRLAIRTGTRNIALSGLLSGALIWAEISGAWDTPIYFDVASWWGWAYTASSTVVLFLLMDYLAYVVHRSMHIRFMFRRVHRFHHRFVATTPWVAVAAHPVEFLVLQAATLAPLLVIPFHAVSAAAVLLYILIYNIVDHSGVRLVSALPWQPPSQFHDDHHAHVHVNFGQHLMLWDRLHGTLRRHGRRYGPEVFGGRGEPGASGPSEERELEPFIRY